MTTSRQLKLAGLLTEVEIKFSINLPLEIETIHSAFKRAGYKIWIVGGAVRDALLNKTPKDFDIVTDAEPKVVMALLKKSGIKSVPIGEQFGVVAAVINGEMFEIATFRSEKGYSDGRRPDKVTFTDMSSDALRRDLTVNSLYYDIDKKIIIDLVGGIEDLKNKKIKTVGNPMQRFEEDRLRVLRVLRFSHRLGSKLDEDTIKAILNFKDLPGVSAERIRAEFLSGLKSAINPEEYLKDYQRLKLFPRVFPGSIINTNFIRGLRDPILVIANMLSLNLIEKALSTLKLFKAQKKEIPNIKFLLEIKNKFENFSKVDFNLLNDGKWLLALKKSLNETNSNLSEEQIIEWSKINKINIELIKKFINFQPFFTAKDFPELPPSKELGDKLTIENAKIFINSL